MLTPKSAGYQVIYSSYSYMGLKQEGHEGPLSIWEFALSAFYLGGGVL